MAIARRTSGSAFTTVASRTTISLTIPAACVADDIAFFWFEKDGNAAVTAPSGWTLIAAPAFSVNAVYHMYWHRIAGGEPGTSTGNWTWTGALFSQGALDSFSGCVTSGDPQDVTRSSNNGSSTTITGTAITTVTANDMIVMLAGNIDNGSTHTTPTGMAVGVDQSSVVDFYVLQATAGSTGAKASTLAPTSEWGAVLVALKEAATGPPAPATTTRIYQAANRRR